MPDSSPQERWQKTVAGFRAWVQEMAESGVDAFPHEAAVRTEEGSPLAAVTVPVPPPDLPDAASALRDVREEIGDCRRCRLSQGRTNLVFGVGNPEARVMFVGEGPGEEEDRRGEPFVGRAGQLLTDIIQNGMGLRRADVYIANVVKCRPPGNRNPQPDEIAACQPFLARQIDAVRPEVIVALGKFAAQTLLETVTPISRLRGHWHEFRGRRLMPTFHPSYLLRNPGDKKLVWQDIQLVMKELGLAVPVRGTRTP